MWKQECDCAISKKINNSVSFPPDPLSRKQAIRRKNQL